MDLVPLSSRTVSLRYSWGWVIQTNQKILHSAMMAPLAALDVSGATGCLIQIEGGLGMTLSQVDSVARLFTDALDSEAQVILGARVSEDLHNSMRVVTLLSGIREG